MNSTQSPAGITAAPFARVMYVMAKPSGARCNLRCEYCYYLEKSALTGGGAGKPSAGISGETSAGAGTMPGEQMDEGLLEKFIREYIAAQTTPEVLFIWHGGEPMLRGLEFYRKALRLEKKYAFGRAVDNSIQTNGTLITEEWCRFFKDNGFLVGVSIDGPEPLHDRFRRNRAGAPSFRRVMRGIELLDRYGVQWNAMATVNSENVTHPTEFYDFFKSIGCRYVQFTPVVERFRTLPDGRRCLATPADTDAVLTDFSITPDQWGDFLCSVFDRWWNGGDVGKQFIQIFDATLAGWMGQPPGLCTFARECGHAGVLEHNGDLYSCDHFVFPEYRLGNLAEKSLVEMMYSREQQNFGAAKYTSLPRQCRECKFLFACNGECPKNRFATADDGERGLNYLCRGYRRFFEHSAPAMMRMRDSILAMH